MFANPPGAASALLGVPVLITNLQDGQVLAYRAAINTWVNATGGAGGGVTSLNALTGAVILAAGSGITLTPSGNTITIASTGGGGAVSSVSNSDGSLTISPTTGAVVASLNLGNANTWSALQTFGSNLSFLGAQVSGAIANGNLLFYNGTNWIGQSLAAGAGISVSGTTVTNTGATSISNSDGTLTISPTTGAVVASLALGHANSWTGIQTFAASGIRLLGTSTGYTTFASANSSATNYTATFPANTGTLAELNLAQTWSALQTFSAGDFAFGGYGADSITAGAKGDIWYYNGTNIVNLAIGSTSQVLTVTGGVPVWAAAGGSSFIKPTQFNPSNPTGTTSTTGVMMGLGSTVKYTPATTGNIMIIWTFAAGNTATTTYSQFKARYGTGTAPANGAAVTGTAYAGTAQTVGQSVAVANLTIAYWISGLTVSTAYWFDIEAISGNAADTTELSGIYVQLWETT